MLYDIDFSLNFIKNPTEAVLSHVTEYEIYAHYLSHAFELGKCFSSPFRRDDSPSFNIFTDYASGRLLYKDFGDPNIKGDCVTFVKEKCNLSNLKQALLKIRIDMITNNNIIRYKLNLPKHASELRQKNVKKIEYVKKRFSKLEKDYWEERGLSLQDLSFFNIFSAEELYVEDELVWKSTPTNPIFVYKDFNKIKGYRPMETERRRKWLSNYSRYDIQGWEQLPLFHEENTLIITKSKKDVAVLRKLGYLAIAPPSESTMIPPAAMKLLREVYGFKKFIILYDRDHGGMTSARKMFIKYRNEYNLTFKFIPKQHHKDVDEMRVKYGKERTIKFLTKLLGYEPNEQLSLLYPDATCASGKD